MPNEIKRPWTAAPWAYVEGDTDVVTWGARICRLYSPVANGHLISAAPELFEALAALVTEIRAYSSPECDEEGNIGAAELKAADAAMARALGK